MGEGQGCQDIVEFPGIRSGFGQGNSPHVRVEGRWVQVTQGLVGHVEEVIGEPLNSSDTTVM